MNEEDFVFDEEIIEGDGNLDNGVNDIPNGDILNNDGVDGDNGAEAANFF